MTALKLNLRFIDVNAKHSTPKIKGKLFIAMLLTEPSTSKYDLPIILEGECMILNSSNLFFNLRSIKLKFLNTLPLAKMFWMRSKELS